MSPNLLRGAREILDISTLILRGGPGSGHFAHKGRPGQRGGSEDTPGKGDDAPATGKKGGRGVPATYENAHAAATDAGNENMRKAGRTAWNQDDYDAATQTFNKIYPAAAMGRGEFAIKMTDRQYNAWVHKLAKMPLKKIRAWQDVVIAQIQLLQKQSKNPDTDVIYLEQEMWISALTDAVRTKVFPKDFPGAWYLPADLVEWQKRAAAGAQPQPQPQASQ
jgi:hypothetical protein